MRISARRTRDCTPIPPIFYHSTACSLPDFQDYVTQILSALNALHTADVLHRGLTPRCIGLAPGAHRGDAKSVKVGCAAWCVALLDMHRSEPFLPPDAPAAEAAAARGDVPEGWLPRDALESPLEYTKNRDVHAVGIVLLQMLMGLDVTERFPDFYTALRNCQSLFFSGCRNKVADFVIATISQTMQQHALAMLAPTKKNVSPHSLLAGMAGVVIGNGLRSSGAIVINGALGHPFSVEPMS